MSLFHPRTVLALHPLWHEWTLHNSPGGWDGVVCFCRTHPDASTAGGRLSTALIPCWSRARRLPPAGQGLPDGSWYLYRAAASRPQLPFVFVWWTRVNRGDVAVLSLAPARRRQRDFSSAFPLCGCPLAGHPLIELPSAGSRGKANTDLLQRVFKVSAKCVTLNFLFSFPFWSG